jgi:hypothetical protein
MLRETETKAGWQIDATGADIKKLKGMLTPTGNEAYRKAFHEQVEPEMRERNEMFASGDGRFATKPVAVVPALPWQADRLPGEKWSEYAKRTGKAEGT